MKKGFFIVLEAVKSTEKLKQATKLYRWLKSLGYDVIFTHHPNWNGEICKIIEKIDGHTILETLLYAADAVEIGDKIKPHLENGKIVISDRFFHSSLAFQTACGADFAWVKELNKFCIKPDLVFYLDSDPNSYDGEKKKIRTDVDLEIQNKARDIYLNLAEKGEIIKVPASQDSEKIFFEIKKHVAEKFGIKE